MANLSLTVISGTSSTRVSRDVLDLVEAIIEVERRLLIAGLALSVRAAGRNLLYTAALLAQITGILKKRLHTSRD
jgi:hypothetical protein